VILVYVEPGQDTSLEAISFARTLGASVEAVVVAGERPEGVPVQRVYHVVHERLDGYAPEASAESIVGLIGTHCPDAVVAAATDRGSEVLGHVAARLDLPLAANVVRAEAGETYTLTRQRWGGSLLEEATLDAPAKLLTVALHVVPPAATEGPPPEVVEVRPDLGEGQFRVRVVRREEPQAGVVLLEDARVVVGGGRGVGSAEGFAALEELAGLLGGAVGGSRVVTNLGWRPHSDQIGQTGARIAPELYIACGISGAIQHMVGCKGARRILAINKDPNAPMVARADYAVIGDLQEIIPALVAELRR
jgi:electron transfer flavoprotein alpha subunit